MQNLPHNIIKDGAGRDDTGRKVLVTSYGMDVDDKKKLVLYKTEGTILWGPYKMWYMAQSKVKSKNEKYEKMVSKKFITDPYWSVHLKKYDTEIYCQSNELEFV
jgi:hypothetical protein